MKTQLICNNDNNYGNYLNNKLGEEISKIQFLTEFYLDSLPDCDNDWSIIVKERYVMSIENQNIQNVDTGNIYIGSSHDKESHIDKICANV